MTRCSLCNNLEKKDEDDVRAAFDFTPKKLLESVSIEECLSCTLILEGIFYFEDETWSFEDDVRLVYAQSLADNDESLSLEVYFCDDRPKLALEFFYKNQENQEHREHRFAAINAGREVSGHPLSRSGLQWITSNLDSCLREHTLCRSNRSVTLPRRVLTFSRDGNDVIRVRIQENDKKEGRYIALSHCWGSTQTCITTTQNLPERKRSIPWAALSKTFQDSIIYSLQLGVHCLWIDALCILQDNPDDWEIESAKMGNIYRDSFVTLAATASKNGQGGCFSSDQDTTIPNEYGLESCQSPTSSIMVREKVKHWIIPPTAATLEHHPLLTRGWTFQERILPPRVIHFCHQEMVWECRNQTVCECHVHAIKSNPMEQFSQLVENTRSGQFSRIRDPLTDTFSSINLMPGSRCTPSDQKALSEQWHRIVEQYSALNLTKETDRLPALSGLAQRASSALGTYLGGLWSETLLPNLMWRVNKLDMKRGRPTKYTGPSWSWVSVNGPISYWADLHHDKLLEIVRLLRPSDIEQARLGKRSPGSAFTSLPVGHHVVSASKNPFGSISSGILVLLRQLKPVILKYVYTRQGFGFDSGRREVDTQKYNLQIDHASSAELPFFADYVLSEEGPYHIEELETLFIMAIHPDICLVLRKTTNVVNSWARAVVSSATNLLVRPLTFERVGIVRQPTGFTEYPIDWIFGARGELVMIN